MSLHHAGRILQVGSRTSAPPRQVWDAWADPRRISQWFTSRASGLAVAGETMIWHFDRFRYEVPYRVLVAEPGRRLALLASTPEHREQIVEIVVEPDAGGSALTLTNSGFRYGAEWDEEYESVYSGWTMALGVMQYYLENHFGQDRAEFFAMRPARFSYAQLLPYYRSPAGLSVWLATAASMGDIGEPYSMDLRHGARASGHLLAVTRREVLLSWSEIQGTMELKAFPMDDSHRAIAIRGCGWGLDAAAAAGIELHLAAALDRLTGVLE